MAHESTPDQSPAESMMVRDFGTFDIPKSPNTKRNKAQ